MPVEIERFVIHADAVAFDEVALALGSCSALASIRCASARSTDPIDNISIAEPREDAAAGKRRYAPDIAAFEPVSEAFLARYCRNLSVGSRPSPDFPWHPSVTEGNGRSRRSRRRVECPSFVWPIGSCRR